MSATGTHHVSNPSVLRRVTRPLAAGLAALAFAALAAQSVQADTSGLAIAFSWTSNGAAATGHHTKARQTAQTVVWGRSGWICVPAGFGRHSHCYMQ